MPGNVNRPPSVASLIVLLLPIADRSKGTRSGYKSQNLKSVMANHNGLGTLSLAMREALSGGNNQARPRDGTVANTGTPGVIMTNLQRYMPKKWSPPGFRLAILFGGLDLPPRKQDAALLAVDLAAKCAGSVRLAGMGPWSRQKSDTVTRCGLFQSGLDARAPKRAQDLLSWRTSRMQV